MNYLIKRIEDGKFVTPPGSQRSYTRDLAGARRFKSRLDATCHCCENEVVIPLEEAFQYAAS